MSISRRLIKIEMNFSLCVLIRKYLQNQSSRGKSEVHDTEYSVLPFLGKGRKEGQEYRKVFAYMCKE